MLKSLELDHVGPAIHLRMELGERLNLLTGDNGLGKSFLLDVAWWALTRTWAGPPAWPARRREVRPRIAATLRGKVGHSAALVALDSTYDPKEERWPSGPGRPPNPGLVLFARVDGGFSVWDPARSASPRHGDERDDALVWTVRPFAYHFTKDEVWYGLYSGGSESPQRAFSELNGNVYCDGLIRDWVSWQRSGDDSFRLLTEVLRHLSADEEECLRPGEPQRISVTDVRDVPTLEQPYGTVPLTFASAAVKRIVAFAYLLVWSWKEHRRAAELRGEDPENRIVFLIDEIEAHLHPRWQRAILPAVMGVASALGEQSGVSVQVVVSTHAPLVLASVEPIFDAELDRLFHLSFHGAEARVEELPWAAQGDAASWLVSETFDLRQARSREAELAIEAAEAFMRRDFGLLPEGLRSEQEIDAALCRAVPDHDRFWPRWIVRRQAAGQ